MKEIPESPCETQTVDDYIENIKRSIESEKDEEELSSLRAELWHAYYHRGSSYYDQGNYESSLQDHLKAVEYNEYVGQEGVFVLFMAIGCAHEKLSEYDQAISYYEKLLGFENTKEDDKAMLLQFIGECFDKKGDERAAYNYFNKLFNLDQDYDGDWYLLYRYAQLSYKFRKFNISQKYLNIMLNITPQNEKIYIQSAFQLLGYIDLEKKLYKQALGHFKKALEVETGSDQRKSKVLFGMAHAYFGLNKFTRAIKYSKKAIEIPTYDETLEKAYYLLAFCYSVKKNRRKEQYYTEKLEHLKPDSPYLRELKSTSW